MDKCRCVSDRCADKRLRIQILTANAVPVRLGEAVRVAQREGTEVSPAPNRGARDARGLNSDLGLLLLAKKVFENAGGATNPPVRQALVRGHLDGASAPATEGLRDGRSAAGGFDRSISADRAGDRRPNPGQAAKTANRGLKCRPGAAGGCAR